MAEVESLSVELRDVVGKRRNRRLRESGRIPAVLYGHKQESQNLQVSADQVHAAIRHGSRFVALKGAVNEKALIKECKWDTWGQEILHIDFTRVGEHEKIRMTVPLEIRGEAPGSHEGGTVKQIMHELDIECEASAVPEKIDVNINQLELNQVIHVSDLHLPQSVTAITEANSVVVNCLAAVEVEESAEGNEGDAEPEVIGRKKEEEDGE